jgi:hypothetical protein
MKLTTEEIELLRDHRFRCTKALQVRDEKQALSFINDVGFCFAFTAKNSELPCLWHAVAGERNPVYPKHTHNDPYISLVWRAKDTLVAERQIYYGKALKNRPTMISLEYFPYFYALLERSDSADVYLADFMRGELSPIAKRIMDALTERSPQITADLKLTSGLAHPKNRYYFDRGMAELQMKMYVVKVAEFYDPFTFLWELVSKHFTNETQHARSISPNQARQKILTQYFLNVFVSDANLIHRLFGWEKGIVIKQLEQLVDMGILRNDIEIEGEHKQRFGIKNIAV